ncbi:MAG TPA: helix-turn-helix domain-containing protein [Bacteroidia bacterium]|nr:helix-turn-helix domain-containing protein [Bacteroidia bacterium]
MVFQQHTPSGPLAHYIENIVFFEGYTAAHKADKLLPDGGIYLIINMLEKPGKLYKNEKLDVYEEFSGCFISGQHKGYIFIEADHSSNMALKFKAGGANPFFDFPISRLNNKVQQLQPILGDGIEELRNTIIQERHIPQKFQLLENYLLGIMRKDHVFSEKFHEVLNFLANTPELASIGELAKKMGVTQKHLITLFSKQVGLNPKALARIYRFQKVIGLLEKNMPVDWLQMTTDCGYYDQAHFIRDFYAFSGIKPSHYPAQKGEYLNYIPVN